MATDDLEIVLGTYENLILGYKIVNSIAQNGILESSFTDDAHRGALRCMAVSPNGVLASSSTDDSVRLHSLRKRKEVGGLFEHEGTVNCIEFFPGGHMFTASEDGTICMWKCKNWEVMKTLKGHKSHVKSIAIHPSGKLALSTGPDKSFLTWDLVTGKLAFQRKLQEAAQNVIFTSESNHFVLVYNTKIEVCSLDTKVKNEITTEWRINAVCPLQDNIIAIGGDSREVLVVDLLKGETLLTLDAAISESSEFNSRVKAICKVERDSTTLIFIATANGVVKGFKVDFTQEANEAVVFLSHETRVRVTCMAAFGNSNETENKGVKSEVVSTTVIQKNGKRKKRKKNEEGEDETVEDEEENDEDISSESEGMDEKRNNAVLPTKLSRKKKRELNQVPEAMKQSQKRKMDTNPQKGQKKFKKGGLEQGKKLKWKNK